MKTLKTLITICLVTSMMLPVLAHQSIRETKINAQIKKSFIAQALEQTQNRNYVEGEIIVYDSGTGFSGDVEIKNNDSQTVFRKIVSTDSSNESEFIEDLADVAANYTDKIVQPNYIYELSAWNSTAGQAKPSDYLDDRHWYFSQSKLPELWSDQDCPDPSSCGGSPDIVVAVMDTGLSYTDATVVTYDSNNLDNSDSTNSDEIADGEFMTTFVASPEYDEINLFVNTGEIPRNNIDDDNNGYIDDVHGIDTFASSLLTANGCILGCWTDQAQGARKAVTPVDTFGHGDFVTGLIAGELNNGRSVSPAFQTSIMPLAVFEHYERSSTTGYLLEAVDYAIDQGADILNMSLGGDGNDPAFEAALNNAFNSGMFLVAASGNDGNDANISRRAVDYPAAYDSVVAVGAANADNSRALYSNYGPELDIVAYVGQSFFSGTATWQTAVACFGICEYGNVGGGHTEFFNTGTSFASPQVAAMAAMLLAKDPSLSPIDIKNAIIQTATDIGTSGRDELTGHGVINFQAAWNYEHNQKSENNSEPTPAVSPVHRFFSPTYVKHFYTISGAERDNIIANNPNWIYEGTTFSAQPNSGSTAKPVYRFWSDNYRGHFYTISESERDSLIRSNPNWTYEGVAYYAFTSQIANTVPLYRFWSDDYRGHFYTNITSERENVIRNDPNWTYEGVAYYVR